MAAPDTEHSADRRRHRRPDGPTRLVSDDVPGRRMGFHYTGNEGFVGRETGREVLIDAFCKLTLIMRVSSSWT